MFLIAAVFAGTWFAGGRMRVPAQTAAKPQAQPQPAKPAPQQAPAPSADDVAARSKAILAHLNAVLRFYHDSEAPIQKVGEPSDLLYRDQAVSLASQVAGLAFQSAKAEAALMARMQAAKSPPPEPSAQTPTQAQTQIPTQAQRLQTTRNNVEQRIADLKSQDAALAQQLETARPKQRDALQQQRQQVEGELELQTAMNSALGEIVAISDTQTGTGFAAEVDQLERSAPELATGKAKTVAPTLENLNAARSSGVTSQAKVLFQLLGSRQSIDNLIGEADNLHKHALALRTPLIDTLRSTMQQGQLLAQTAAAPAPGAPAAAASSTAPQAAPPAATATPAATRKSFDELTKTYKGLSAAAVPLSQEILTLEEGRAGLEAWRTAVNEEYTEILRSLLLRVAAIAVALFVIFIVGEIWRRATTRYVRDVRRRRQLLIVRRLITGFLSGVVLIFGLVTQFNSLATFAGFITAGLAVGLQTILLSVAAYFFIIGRYGVRVGDRITIAGVTGDVVEVGLVRFYMLEMAGTGTDLYPTGRVAVFSNAVLFQALTPLYKQMPGTEYAWHELTVKLSADVDYRPAVQELLKSVQAVYEGYRAQIEQQHKHLEKWMDSSVDSPALQSNVQLMDGGLQFWVRFPVIIRQAALADEQMTESLLRLIAGNPEVKAAVTAPPAIKAAVRG